MRGLYFIEHGLANTQVESLYQALEESLAPIGLRLYESPTGSPRAPHGMPQGKAPRAPHGVDTGKAATLMDVCQKIYLSTIGIFDLSVPNPNTYLEIGISLGLNMPGVIIAGQGMTSAIPPALKQANTWFYTPPLRADKDLQRVVLRLLNKGAKSQTHGPPSGNSVAESPDEGDKTYCIFCGRVCKGWQEQTRSKGFFLLDGSYPWWSMLRDTIRTGLSPTGLAPIYLSQIRGRVMPLLCEIRLAVFASEFTLLDLSGPYDPEQYIALGMAIGMRRPWLLTTSQPKNLPSLLRQAGRLEYTNGQDLQQRLGQHVLKSLYPARFAATGGVTTRLELPFWLQLEDWITRFKARTSRVMEGTLQLLLIEEGQLKQRCRMTPDTTITAGRDPECELVIESQSASRFHADFTFTGQELFVLDHESTNGTFVGGSQIPPNERVALEIGDRVRIGPAEVVIWNEDELPDEIKEYLPESGRITPQTIFVNLADGLVLANGKVPVARLSSSEIILLKFMHEKGGDTTATSEIAALPGVSARRRLSAAHPRRTTRLQTPLEEESRAQSRPAIEPRRKNQLAEGPDRKRRCIHQQPVGLRVVSL
jgi:hypothetical protein